MPKKREMYLSLTPEQLAAEQAGKAALYNYCRGGIGRQKELAEETGILASILSRLALDPNKPINLEHAVLIDVATNGELPAEVLCPARADVLAKLIERHMRGAAVPA